MAISFVRAFTAPKSGESPNEDRYAVSLDRSACAISDGASVAFDSGPWAEILANGFVHGQSFTREWLAEAAAAYLALYDRETMDWMQQGALDRGSFASLIGVRPGSIDMSIEVVSVGDSMLAVLEAGELVLTVPYTDSKQFESSPQLICTSAYENEGIFDNGLEVPFQTIDLSSYIDPIIILVSDALGQWILDHKERSHELLSKLTQEEFEEFISSEREFGRMRRDDTTLLIMDCHVSTISH